MNDLVLLATLEMRPIKLLIFGNPKAMLATPSIALELPLKVLVWEDRGENVWLSYNSPDYLTERHGLPQDLVQNVAVVKVLVTAPQSSQVV
jgi:uncharacterized protein (DUF302 family)